MFGMYTWEEKCMQVLGGEPFEKGPVWRPKHRWKYDVKMYLRGVEGLDWIHLAGDKDKC
jgi:hypothetical protein